MRRPNLTYANVISTAALVAVAGAFISASHAQTNTPQIAVCVQGKGVKKGTIRVLPKAAAKCRKGEKKLQWNTRGLPGATGARGATGPAGPAGATGQTGPAGASTAGGGSSPSGLVGYFDAATCPSGWSEFTSGRGRTLVGLQPGGTLGEAVGNELTAGENRAVGQHAHTIIDPGHSHAVLTKGDRLTVPGLNAIAGNQGSAFNQLQPSTGNALDGTKPILPGTTGITINPAGSVPGTNAPYVQLLACRKD